MSEKKKKRKKSENQKVSNKGRIITKTGLKTFGYLQSNGYYRARINNKKVRVHRIVAEHFLGPAPTDKAVVNHIDGNKKNNNVENLEWTTHSQNNKHSFSRLIDRPTGAKERSCKIEGRKISESEWTMFESINDAARKLSTPEKNVRPGNIHRVCQAEGRQTMGYTFRYVDTNHSFLNGETWKEWEYSGNKVSNFGRVWHKTANRITTGYQEQNGYMTTKFGQKHHYVHRLVAFLFIGDAPTKNHTVNHKDLNRSNNHVNNLEWATMKEQAVHSREKNSNRKSGGLSRSKQVSARVVDSINWKYTFSSVQIASDELCINPKNISSCCSGMQSWATSKKDTLRYEFCIEEQPNLSGEIWKKIKD